MSKPELLSPAGSPESLRAAVQNGANAVYLGWGEFNARRGAKNFSDEEFAEALRYCHARNVRVFLTLNTLVTDRELPRALETARTACRLGVDSVILQDWGLMDVLRKALPDLPRHGSTQMSAFTTGGVLELEHDGCERIVIARENSREDTASRVRRDRGSSLSTRMDMGGITGWCFRAYSCIFSVKAEMADTDREKPAARVWPPKRVRVSRLPVR